VQHLHGSHAIAVFFVTIDFVVKLCDWPTVRFGVGTWPAFPRHSWRPSGLHENAVRLLCRHERLAAANA
jgi:hypothetical protein